MLLRFSFVGAPAETNQSGAKMAHSGAFAFDPNEPSLWDGNLVSAYILVLTNLFIVPAFMLAAWRGSRTTAIILFSVYVNSCLYHSCRGGFFCLMHYLKHRTLDYLAVYNAMTWFIYMIGARRHDFTIDERRHTEMHFATMIVTTMAIIADVGNFWLPVIGIGIPVLVVLVLDTVDSRTFVYRPKWAWATLACFLVGGAAFAFGNGAYWWAHGVWHTFVMLGIACFMIAISPCTAPAVECGACRKLRL